MVLIASPCVRVPLAHGFRSHAQKKTFFAWHGLRHWYVHWLPVDEEVALTASRCIILGVWAPTTGSMSPRVRIVPVPDAGSNVFRIARLAPLVGPLVTRGQGYCSHGLSLRYIASLASDHGFHWSTGWGCKRLGEIQKRFSHDQGRTTAGEPPAPHGCFDVVLSHLSALRGGCFTPQSGFFYICLKIIYFKKIRL